MAKPAIGKPLPKTSVKSSSIVWATHSTESVVHLPGNGSLRFVYTGMYSGMLPQDQPWLALVLDFPGSSRLVAIPNRRYEPIGRSTPGRVSCYEPFASRRRTTAKTRSLLT